MPQPALRHRAISVTRRGVQLATVGLLLTLVSTSLYAHYHAARALDDLAGKEGWRWRLMELLDVVLGRLEDPIALLDGFGGTLWSMRLGPIDITDPLAAAEVLFTTASLPLTLAVSVLIPVVGTALLGKVYCSWFCPGYLLFEISGKLRGLLRLAEIQPASVEFSILNKYLLLAAGLVVAAMLGAPFFSLVYPPAVISRTAHSLVFGVSVTGGLLLMGGLLLVELLVSPRWWCRTICPGGALYGLLGWGRPLRVALVPGRCDGCRTCGPACEMGLDPVRESSGIECDNCGRCLAVCPQVALAWKLAAPRVRFEPSSGDEAA